MKRKKVLFSEKQLRVIAFPNTDYDALICDGSVRSGKTSVMSVAFILWAMRDFNGCNFAICSKTVGTAVKNVIRPLLGMGYLTERYDLRYMRTDGRMVISGNGHTNVFYIYGGKDESSYQLIQGITLAGVFLDEVALMPRSFVEQAMARCSVSGSRFWFNCNPEGQMHWFNQEWIEKADERNALRLHFTMDDNPALAEDIRQRYERMYSGVFYRRYILGEWCMAEGLVYDMFDNNVHVIRMEKEPETEGDYYVSSDYGIQNATVFLLWRRIAGSVSFLCLREYYYSGRENMVQKTVSELVDGFDSFLPEYVEPSRTIVDPSATALIAELRKRGHSVLPAKNDVINGISDVSTMLRQNRLLFMECCKKTIGEFGAYIWDEKACQRGEDKPIKDNDHAMDAVRYFVYTKRLVRKTGFDDWGI